ncbi:hypothetical protein E4T47_03487 [Aureobasidium subglaciale]|nr:hypothetical protein E4T47_03487 [Aureobasidium subglaciale]
MTTFAQHPNNEAPDVPYYTAPEPHSQQYMPNQQAQQQMRQPAPPTQQYPPEDQHYLQSRYAGPESVQNQHPLYPAMSSHVQPPGDSYYEMQRSKLPLYTFTQVNPVDRLTSIASLNKITQVESFAYKSVAPH